MVSIIMPTYNRFDIAGESIQKVLHLESEVTYELIVVNDGEELPFALSDSRLRILRNPGKGVSSARNYGASLAKYPVLFFIDDDMWITPETLTIIMGLYHNSSLENNYFNLNWVYPDHLKNKLRKNKIGRFLLSSRYHTLEGRSKMTIDYTVPVVDHYGVGSCSFCISKANFIKVHGYNEQIEFQGEDTDLARRLVEAHIHPKLVTEVSCFHNQEDRLEIEGFTDRIYRGFVSQAKAGMISAQQARKPFLKLLLPLYPFVKFLYKCIPNHPLFDSLTFRLIGLLSALSLTRAVRDAATAESDNRVSSRNE